MAFKFLFCIIGCDGVMYYKMLSAWSSLVLNCFRPEFKTIRLYFCEQKRNCNNAKKNSKLKENLTFQKLASETSEH